MNCLAPAAWTGTFLLSVGVWGQEGRRTPLRLSIAEKVGQMLQVQAYAETMDDQPASSLQVTKEIHDDHIGAVDFRVRVDGSNLLRPEPTAIAATLNALQKEARIPLLVGSDIERGMVSRSAGAPDLPNAMALGAARDLSLIEASGKMTAEEAVAVGINWAFAPVADVNIDPDDPIIGDRSFGDDVSFVGKAVTAYIAGAHRRGLLTTAKHFPGQGGASVDSHVEIVTINKSIWDLRHVELLPFRDAIAAGVDAVMLAHVRVPAFEPDPQKVATTSTKMIERTLRQEMGFKGVVVTDAMDMKGLLDLYKGSPDPIAQAAVDAVKAGADMILLSSDVDGVYRAILRAVKTGEIPESRIDQSVSRILAMKERAGLFKNRFVDVSKVEKIYANPEAWLLAQRIADESVTLVRDNGVTLPLRNGAPEKTVLVVFSDSIRSPLGREFEKAFKERQPNVQVRHVYYDHRSEWETSDVLQVVADADRVVLGTFMTNVPGRKALAVGGQVVNVAGLNGGNASLFKQILDSANAKTMVVSLGSPYLILKYPNIKNYVCTFSVSSTSERSTVKALFGEIHNKARLPVTIPGVAERGFAIPWPEKTSSIP